MKSIPLLLVLAACSTWWRPDDGTDVVDALNAAGEGEAVLVTTDTAYLIRNGALKREIGALTKSIATASAHADSNFTWYTPDRSDVSAYAYPGRQLELDTPRGRLLLQRAKGHTGTRYWATLRRSSRLYLYLTVRGSAALDAAWMRVEQAAASRSGVVMGPTQFSGFFPEDWGAGTRFVDSHQRDVGVDFRGLDQGPDR